MATDNNFIQPSIPRFDGHYNHWSMLMENFLQSNEYWITVETGVSEVAEGTVLTKTRQKKLDEQKLKDLKGRNYLFSIN